MIKFAILLLLAVLIFGIYRTQRGARRSVSAEERSTSIRLSAFAWVVGFAFLIAFLFLPNKQRVILLVPFFLFAVSFAKYWRDRRARFRRESAESARLEKMKRVN